MIKLLKTEPLQCGESLPGYILRLTELNYYDRPSRITSLAGVPIATTTPSFMTTPGDLTLLATLSDVPVEELQRRTYPAVQRHKMPFRVVSFFGHPVSHSVITYDSAKICPACLQEIGCCHAVWDLLPVTTCPVHTCLLLRHCPGCRKRISWKRTKLCVCDCGFDWRNSAVSLIDQREIKLAQLVHQLLQLPVRANSATACANDNPLLSLDLLHLFTAVLFIAGQNEGFTDITGGTYVDIRQLALQFLGSSE